MEFNEDQMRRAISADMFATDIALAETVKGVPFRAAYLEAKKSLDRAGAPDAASSLAQRVSPGACGDLQLDRIKRRLEQKMKEIEG
jgi:argininosuccinate lyase